MKKQMFFSVKALIIKNDTFLAVYNLVAGIKIWDLPGGRMEFGEMLDLLNPMTNLYYPFFIILKEGIIE